MLRLLGFLLFIPVICGEDFGITRLNYKVVPQHYGVWVKPFIYEKNNEGKEWAFSGQVEIDLIVNVDNVTSIELHVHPDLLKIKMSLLRFNDFNDKKNEGNFIQNTTYLENQIISYGLSKTLKRNESYVLVITYDGEIADDMHGFYRSTYIENGEDIRIAVTQFEDSYARRFMPCFDEPNFKANFTLQVCRRNNMRSWSNMPIKDSTRTDKDYTTDNFETTPNISTYMLALLVAEFKENSITSDDEIRFGVVSRTKAYGHYALSIAPHVLKHFGEQNKHPYKKFFKHKLDMVAVPDFAAGAMENPGLVTFRESLLLYNPQKASSLQKKRITHVVTHEFAHMWFGNLVTCKWWSYTWLNEGFATFFQQTAIPGVEVSEDFPALFTVDVMHAALEFDATNRTFPMTNMQLKTHGDIRSMFNLISYNKGASVLRMLQHHIGAKKFQNALVEYITKRRLKTAVPEDLMIAMNKVQTNSKIDVIFRNFTESKSFPLVTVEINGVRDQARLYQMKFAPQVVQFAKVVNVWHIPITFVSKKQHSFDDTTTKIIMDQPEVTVSLTPVPNDWVIFNVQQIGYYRVNYDNNSWSIIIEALKSEDHDMIHETNRAQLLDDILNVAKMDHVGYPIVFDLLNYMRKEKNYIAWRVFFMGISDFRDRIPDNDQDAVEGYVNFMIREIYEDFTFIPDPSETQIHLYHRMLLFPFACQYHHSDCVDRANDQFKELQTDRDYQIPVDVREVVFCTAIREGDLDTFTFLWKRFLEEDVETEKITIINALGCTNNDEVIQKLMEKIFSKDVRDNIKFLAFIRAVRGNPENVQRVWEYLKKNHQKMSKNLVKGYDDLRKYIHYVINLLKTPEQLAEVEAFCRKNCKKIGFDLELEINNLRKSIQWDDEHVPEIVELMRLNMAGRITANFGVALKFLLVAMFVYIL